MTCLSFIMINVGYEFDIDKERWRTYIQDYLIAMTAAGFPWIFVAVWFVFVVPSPLPWGDALLAARFAAPTSAGILFSMLEAAGMKDTWLFRKARVLAIFDDLDTVLLMIPLKVALVGFKWELSLELLAVFSLLLLSWSKLHAFRIPCSWNYTALYAVFVAGSVEALAYLSGHEGVPMEAVHLEVLLPAFAVGFLEGSAEEAAADLSVGQLGVHVLLVSLLMVVGKMFPLFCYRKEANIRARLALALGMCPRGEVGAGVIVISIAFGICGPCITIAVMCLALNLVASSFFIMGVKKLVERAEMDDTRHGIVRDEKTGIPIVEGGISNNNDNNNNNNTLKVVEVVENVERKLEADRRV
ncbi:hypothetical protein TrRE_jg2289 [Triparma retinervis]|uniref:Uncharacterized protein n=1 Tax=Triparma retinervis TaxID=2557542 RepID=A0A9W6Z8Q6_9STRA|nr:hypothetical protein TrRE_jg2289 [Triparma retinervis]